LVTCKPDSASPVSYHKKPCRALSELSLAYSIVLIYARKKRKATEKTFQKFGRIEESGAAKKGKDIIGHLGNN